MVTNTVAEATILYRGDTVQLPRDLEKTKKISEDAGEDAGEAYADGMSTGIKKNAPVVEKQVRRVGDRSVRRMTIAGEDSGDKFGEGFWRRARRSLVKPMNVLDQQAKAIAAIIAATFSETAALGSGLAATLTAVGGSVAYAAAGLGAMSALLPGLAYGIGLAASGLSRVDELAPRAAESIDNLGRVFREVDVPRFMAEWDESLSTFLDTLANSLEFDQIAEGLGGAFATITDAFTGVLQSPAWSGFVEAMEGTLPTAIGRLGEGAADLASVLLNIFDAAATPVAILTNEFALWAEELAEVFQAANDSGELLDFFTEAAESLELVMDLVLTLAEALGNVFSAGKESGDEFLGILNYLADEFLAWTESIGGQNALRDWFEQGLIIIEALLPLVGAIATAIANLVTPEAVEQLLTFITSLTNFVPILGQVLELFTDLNVIGIIAALLDAVTAALEPVMPQLSTLAVELGEALVDAIVVLTPLLVVLIEAIADILPILVPLLPKIVELIEVFVDGLAPIVEDLAPIIADLAEIMVENLGVALDGLIPLIEILTDVLQIGADVFRVVLAPAIDYAREAFRKMRENGQKFIDRFLNPLKDMISNVSDAFDDLEYYAQFAGDGLKDIGRKIQRWVIDRLEDLVAGVKNVNDWFADLGDNISGVVDRIVGALGRISWPSPPSWLTSGSFGGVSFFAEGGVVAGPTRAVIGEAGPEMVVPLARPLSQVDPAVRDVAAYAQGKTPAFANGGMAGGGISLATGAIQVVSPYSNPALVAEEVLDDLVLAGR